MTWLLLPLLLLMYTSRWLLALATRPGLGARTGLPKSPVLLLLLVWRWKPPVGGAAAIARCDRLFDFFMPGASGATPQSCSPSSSSTRSHRHSWQSWPTEASLQGGPGAGGVGSAQGGGVGDAGGGGGAGCRRGSLMLQCCLGQRMCEWHTSQRMRL